MLYYGINNLILRIIEIILARKRTIHLRGRGRAGGHWLGYAMQFEFSGFCNVKCSNFFNNIGRSSYIGEFQLMFFWKSKLTDK